MARTKKVVEKEENNFAEQDQSQMATMNDVLIMVKDLTKQGYDWQHPLVIRWQYDDEPYVFELVVVNDKSQLVFDEHAHGLH